MYEGICEGGPLDGLTYTIRTEKFIAVDKPAGLVWLYSRNASGAFQLVTTGDEADPATGARPLDSQRAIGAALDETMDVVSVPDAATNEEEEVQDDGSE